MQKITLDLSEKKYAEQSMNTTAMTGVYIMDAVLALAYAIELIKGARTPASYAVVAALCILPCVISQLIYSKKKDSGIIRYILGIGFIFLYGYVMMTSATNLTFCYVIVAFVALVVYADIKYLLTLGILALLINVIKVIYLATTAGLSAAEVTESEIIFACLILTGTFVIMATKKINLINQAHVDKAEKEKTQSEELLNTTLEVAAAISVSIDSVVAETEDLKEAIGQTKYAMGDLTSGANDASAAMEEQTSSTARIGKYIQGVEDSAREIISESQEAQSSLEQGSRVMDELMQQVKASETNGILVTEKVTGLKEYADRMQEIMGLISNVADQTGLLALNASIEAARAGEAGRGFGVVASEISNLSEQTNAATEDITDLIRNIVHSIEEAAGAMNLLLDSSQKQNQYVGITAESFNKINKSTKGIIDHAAKLKAAVDAVTQENIQIEERTGQVSSITQEVTARSEETLEACNKNLESVEEVAAIMENIKEEARKLQQEG